MGGLVTLDVSGFNAILGALTERGYSVVGPTVADGAVVYGPIASVADLPVGWGEAQEAGTYRLVRRPDDALFGYAVGPHSPKRYLFPPRSRLWSAERDETGWTFCAGAAPAPRLAFVGVRPCELAAMAVQDRVFLDCDDPDPTYAARRREAFVVAVSCTVPAPTCFCTSMGTGPRAEKGFDLAVTELIDEDGHRFLIEAGSEAGAEVLAPVPQRPATSTDEAAAARAVGRAEQEMVRALDPQAARRAVLSNPEHPRWSEVAGRCLTCGNCTMVCPTCFCSTVEDTADLSGDHAERWRRWDSCYSVGFSYLHGGSIRQSATSRYRQWLTHKLGTWWDQFGTSGCVGCGRCITWCPVGIDLTEEAAALASGEGLA